MQLRYYLSAEDLITHQMYLYRHDPVLVSERRRNLRKSVLFTLLFVGVFALIGLFTGRWLGFVIILIYEGCVWAWRLTQSERRYERWLRRIVDKSETSFDEQITLTLDEFGVTQETSFESTKILWNRFRSFDQEPQTISLCQVDGGQIVIPNRAFSTPQEKDAFLATYERLRTAPPPGF